MASSAYKNKTGLPFLFSFCLKFFNKLSENVGEAADAASSAGSRLRGGKGSCLKRLGFTFAQLLAPFCL